VAAVNTRVEESVAVAGGREAPWLSPFVRQFHAEHGRAPRVLHIGNIANNAYLNAKILNRHGFDCDVLCYDYYHIMGCPEWEECDFAGTVDDQFRPDWSVLDLKGYERPRWFAQGPRHIAIEYLIAKRSGLSQRADRLWSDLRFANYTLSRPSATADGLPSARRDRRKKGELTWTRLHYAVHRIRDLVLRTRASNASYLAWAKLEAWAARRGDVGFVVAAFAAPFVVSAVVLLKLAWRLVPAESYEPAAPRVRATPRGTKAASVPADPSVPAKPRKPNMSWVAAFAEAFPDRPDQLTASEYEPYVHTIGPWRRLFDHYDIIQAYSTDVAFPMFAGKRPYVGFEHGTLRVFTLADNTLSRITALGYHCADHVMITNGDCLPYARKIKVKATTPMPHPFDDAFMRTVPDGSEALHQQHGVKYLFLCPLRHDWEIKGTDKYIRSLPAIADAIGRDFRVIMTEWGGQVAASKELARTLGVDDLIVWGPPLNRVQLVRHLKAADIVFDQIALPCFGGTAPQAIAVGVPVIMSYDPASTEWLVPEPAPILTAWTAEDIVTAVRTALDPAWRAAYRHQAERWYETHHSSRRVVEKHSEVYTAVSRAHGLLATP
jgi:glycosyltransferase involved in cell wall biosynthesis